jgi:hypothetical protein
MVQRKQSIRHWRTPRSPPLHGWIDAVGRTPVEQDAPAREQPAALLPNQHIRIRSGVIETDVGGDHEKSSRSCRVCTGQGDVARREVMAGEGRATQRRIIKIAQFAPTRGPSANRLDARTSESGHRRKGNELESRFLRPLRTEQRGITCIPGNRVAGDGLADAIARDVLV